MSHSAVVSAKMIVGGSEFMVGKLSPTCLTVHHTESKDISKLTGLSVTIELTIDGRTHRSQAKIASVDAEKRQIGLENSMSY